MLSLQGYSIGERIYESERTWVFRACAPSGETVVLKASASSFPDAHVLRQLRREYEIGRRFNHEHIIGYHDLVQTEHRLVVVEEDFGGVGLSRLQPGEAFDTGSFLNIAIQLTSALAATHRGNVIHKDVKPSNVVINEKTGLVKLIDFGIASRLRQESRQAIDLQELEGSLHYIAPEQTGRMGRALDYRADFYALGATFYELLTGAPPFPVNDPLELVHAHLAQVPVAPHEHRHEIPPVLSDIVLKLLSKNAEDRYQSAFGLRRDLERCQVEMGRDEMDRGETTVFALAQHDHSERFQIPQKLFGRRQQVAQLLQAFDRATSTRSPEKRVGAEMLLVAGYSGVGKSALVREIQRPITACRGFFAAGKFDLGQHTVPYSAISNALGELCRALLTERASQLERWKWRLLDAVGSNGRLLIDLVPGLGHILGDQPAVSPTSPQETRDRFHRTFFRFLDALSPPEQPMALFLDDLQWADSASLRLLKAVMTGGTLNNLLVIGAYRDNEVDAGHPLAHALKEIEEHRGKLPRIKLRNLDLAAVHELVTATLKLPPAEGRPLAELVYGKTRGNAFFTTELLSSLHRDGIIFFRHPEESEKGGWTWDAERIRDLSITDNVVSLVASKIGDLKPRARQTLELAACLGSNFELSTLTLIQNDGHGRRSTLEDLWPAVQEGLVFCLDSTATLDVDGGDSDEDADLRFKFAHDRVRQAAYSRIDEAERNHLRIGRLLRADARRSDQLEKRLFKVVNQLNPARSLIHDEDERLELAELNLMAGCRAKAASAHDTATGYLRVGIELLPGGAWNQRYRLAFDLHKELAEAEYLAARFEASEALFETLLDHADSEIDRTEVLFIQLEQLALQGRYAENLEIGRRALELLGVEMPLAEEEVEALFEAEIRRLEEGLCSRRVADLVHEPPLRDVRYRQVMRILPNLAVAVFFLNRHDLLKWSVVQRVNIAMRHGHDELTSLAYVGYGVNVAAAHLRDYDAALEFGNVAMALAERYNHAAARGRVAMLFAVGIQHWHRQLKEGRDLFRQGFELCVEGGDFSYAGYSAGIGWTYDLVSGRELDLLNEEIEGHLPFLTRTCGAMLRGAIRPSILQQLACLTGQTSRTDSFDSEDFSESEFLATGGRVPFFLALFNLARMRCFYLFGHVERALPLVAEAEPWVETTMPGQANVPEFYFYAALIVAAAWDKTGDTDSDQRAELGQRLDGFCEKLASAARQSPVNYGSMHLLAVAEKARLRGDSSIAMNGYTKATRAAQRSGSLAHEAIANELYGRLWLARDEADVGAIYLLRARALHSQWGASAKVAQLDKLYPDLALRESGPVRDRSGTVTRMMNLDLATVVKASQAISGELRLDELLGKITDILVENTGAERGCLLLRRGGEARVTTSSATGNKRPAMTPPRAVLDYVERTGEEVILGDIRDDERFAADPQIAGSPLTSVLCMPVRRQIEEVGYLYLENNLVANAFTAQRLEVLRLLLAQAVISLENAFLYGELKRHIDELENKNAELERFNYTVSHDLKSPLVTIQGFLGLLRQDIHKGNEEAIEKDFATISSAVSTMASLLHDLLELSRIGHGLGTLRTIDLNALTADVIALSQAGQVGVKVDVADDLPQILGDPTRIREVFQNLLDNALRYTAQTPEPRIEIGVRPETETERYVIYVRDNGLGIDPRYHEKVFMLFEKLDSTREGTGIGLALVKRIVEMHGGRIWVESDGLGHGSTFFMSFDSPTRTVIP